MAALRNPHDLKPHPKLGPGGILPGLTDEEYAGLRDSIRRDGIMQPIVVAWPERIILDGHHRWAIAQELGMEQVPVMLQEFGDEAAHLRLGWSLNRDRRHLTGDQKRAAAAALLMEDPAQSDRSVAAVVGTSPTTIGSVRADLEEQGMVSKLDTRTGQDGVKQPARKPRPTGSTLRAKKPAKPKHEKPEGRQESEGPRPAPATETVAETQGAEEPVAPPPAEQGGESDAPAPEIAETPQVDERDAPTAGQAEDGPRVQPPESDSAADVVLMVVRSLVLPVVPYTREDVAEVAARLTEDDITRVRETGALCGALMTEHARKTVHAA